MNLSIIEDSSEEIESNNDDISDEESSDSDDETTLNVKKKSKKIGGLKVMAVNKTQTILIHLKLDADKFDYYSCTKKKLILGINMLNFYRLIKTMSNFDTLTLAIDDDDINKLIIRLENGDKNCISTYKLNLMDLDVEDIESNLQNFLIVLICYPLIFIKYVKICTILQKK